MLLRTHRLVTLAALVPLTAPAVTYDWIAATGGSLNDPAQWSPAPPTSPAADFTGADIAQLTKDFAAAPTFTLDGNLTVNTLIYDDTGAATDVGATITSGTDAGNTLTFGGTNPTITVTPALGSPGLTVSAKLAGTAGLLKNGQGGLTLSGDNSGLIGTLTIADPGATNSGGVYLASLASLGGITNVTTQGTTGTGGFFRIVGTAVTIPNTVTFNLSGQGGNSAPNGSLVAAGTGIHTVQGTITLNTGSIRISNASATRFDIEGPILGGTFNATFRLAANEGLHLVNTSNAWSGGTIHSGGILWYEPGALPNSGNLQLAASDPGTVQTKGTFSRALGSGGGQFNWVNANQTTTMREGGFSARGGDLTVNLGGAAADVTFFNSATVTGTRAVGSNSVTAVNTTNLVVGMSITGTGIPNTTTTITAIPTPGTSGTITISANATTAATATALVCTSYNVTRINTNSVWLNNATADSKLTFANPLDLNGATRNVRVDANVAELAGGVKNTSANAATLSKTGLGTLLLSATASTTYSLSVANGGGTLEVANPGAIPAAATLSLPKTSTSTGTLKLNTAGTNSFANAFGSFASSNGLPNGGTPNILNVLGNNTFSGSMSITGTGGNGVNLSSDAGSLTFSGNLVNNVANSNRSYSLGGIGSGTISGNLNNGSSTALTSLVKTGTGTWNLTGSSSNFTGAINLMDGVLAVASLADTGTNSSVGAGGAINFGGQATTGTLRYAGASAQSTNHPVNLLATGGVIESSGVGALTLTGAVTATDMAAFNLNYTTGSATATNTVTLVPGTAVGMAVTAAGLDPGTTITAVNGNSYTLSSPFTGATAAVSTAFSTPARTLTLAGSNAGANTVSGVIADSVGGGQLALAKSGAGAWFVSGANTYTGGTTIGAGTLKLGHGSALGTGAASVASGATLDLGGQTVINTVTVSGGASLVGSGSVLAAGNTVAGIIAPGNSAGTINFSNNTLTLAPTAVANLEIGGTAPSTYDVIGANGPITLAAGSVVNVSFINGFIPAAGNTWNLLNDDGGVTSAATLNLPALSGGLSWNTALFASQGVLSIVGGDPLPSWASGFSLVGPDSLADADPDKDGIKNSLEYAFGLAPNVANPQPEYRGVGTATAGQQLALAYRRPVGGVSGVTYGVQVKTADLDAGDTGWSDALLGTDYTQTITGNGDGSETVKITFTGAVTTGKKFGRVSVSF